MPGVTSLSVLFLLLALCPLDVAGFPEDIQAIYFKNDDSTFRVINLATKEGTDLFSAAGRVSAMDYDPVTKKVFWCQTDRKCYAQDYSGSNPTLLFTNANGVKEIQKDGNSTFYFLDYPGNIWVKRDGQEAVLFTGDVHSFTVDKLDGRMIYIDANETIRDFAGKLAIQTGDLQNTVSISWNPQDRLLYLVVNVYSTWKMDIRSIDLDTGELRTIRQGLSEILRIQTYRDVIVFSGSVEEEPISLYAMYTNGTNLTSFGLMNSEPYVRPVILEAINPPGDVQDSRAIFTWTPKIGCLQTNAGTSIKVTLTPELEDFSLLVMDPPMECSRDLGQFRQDITVPESCVVDQEVEVAIQLTEIKDILGGRFFRHFLFSCSDLGPDGNAMELIAETNPSKTQATASNTSYADGSFSLMVVTSANLNSGAELTSATNVIWSQDDVFLVLRHRLATGSQHRTLIPAECTINSTSHPEKKAIWLSKPDMECKHEMGLIDAWTIQSKRTVDDDVTYSQLFPFDFQVGEEVTITCDARECPYVADAGQLQGKCLEAFKKYKSCGGTFLGSSPKRRREVTSLSGNGNSVLEDQAASRVMSASFTLG